LFSFIYMLWCRSYVHQAPLGVFPIGEYTCQASTAAASKLHFASTQKNILNCVIGSRDCAHGYVEIGNANGSWTRSLVPEFSSRPFWANLFGPKACDGDSRRSINCHQLQTNDERKVTC
jgi:hypothetical protein